jgi:seryl-tRNA synthetase
MKFRYSIVLGISALGFASMAAVAQQPPAATQELNDSWKAADLADQRRANAVNGFLIWSNNQLKADADQIKSLTKERDDLKGKLGAVEKDRLSLSSQLGGLNKQVAEAKGAEAKIADLTRQLTEASKPPTEEECMSTHHDLHVEGPGASSESATWSNGELENSPATTTGHVFPNPMSKPAQGRH